MAHRKSKIAAKNNAGKCLEIGGEARHNEAVLYQSQDVRLGMASLRCEDSNPHRKHYHKFPKLKIPRRASNRASWRIFQLSRVVVTLEGSALGAHSFLRQDWRFESGQNTPRI